jgi:hypothetical protein
MPTTTLAATARYGTLCRITRPISVGVNATRVPRLAAVELQRPVWAKNGSKRPAAAVENQQRGRVIWSSPDAGGPFER